MTRTQRAARGFSLVESTVSVLLIGLAIAAYLPAQINSRKLVTHNRRSELAATLAGAVIDFDRNGGYLALALGTSSLPNGMIQPDLPNMTGSATVALVDHNMQPTATDVGRKRVDVKVSWDDKHGDTGSITDSSVIAND